MRLSNNLGNQMFMYAAAYAFSKKLDRELFVDEETAYQKNIIHEYNLNIFNFSSKIAPSKLKFLGSYGYLRRKILKYSDNWYNFDVMINDIIIKRNKIVVHYKWEGSKAEGGNVYYFSAMEIFYIDKKTDLIYEIKGLWSEKQFRDQFE